MLPQWRFVSTAGVEPHAGVGEVVARYESELETELGVALGKSAVELDSLRAHVRTRETNMGNLIADAMRAALGTDVGLTNGGGIRGDRTYEPGTTLTRKDVLAELPFGNVGVSMELSGGDLRAAIENGVSRVEDTAGRFPQVSGMAFTYDPSRPQGNRIVEITVGGAPLDDARSYTVATNDYIAAGGDGYGALKNGRLIVDSSGGTLMASQVMSYIAARGTVAPQVEGRITATR
jgi:2',3'-cyclic-nucleotide 2'-phosphodiesterase (5'-nucleotidase family)